MCNPTTFTAIDNPVLAAFARQQLTDDLCDADVLRRVREAQPIGGTYEEALREAHAQEDALVADAEDAVAGEFEDELRLEIVLDDARHALSCSDIRAAAFRWLPTVVLACTLVAPEDLAYELLEEFEDQFAAEGFACCSGKTLADAIAGLLLFGEKALSDVAAHQNGGR